ncbi:MAG TPA: carboxypeptidase-like regulatory domain-containing protein [Candidatus Thermoplasmatota archaeon]|nr:carboxypeptidase-like regulatory domain-containing protein [Candidatus Thermoplasmatota archaeon]
MRALLVTALLVAALLAGCATKASDAPTGGSIPDPGEVAVTQTTGGIRGVVVDQAIRPLAGATVVVSGQGTNKTLTTDATGAFTLAGLQPGTYFLKASKPLYDTQQQAVEVKAGVAPPVTKVQLNQVVFAKPYMQTLKFKGFIVCSGNYVVLLSEECGEGVGVPCVQDPAPCGRVGGQANNHVQYDFYVDNPNVKTLVVEQYWVPTQETGKAFYTPVSLNWVCDPLCGGDTKMELEGESPLLGRMDADQLEPMALNSTTKISTFTWASRETTGLVLNQDFQVFVSTSYYLPLPADWSFVQGSADPFA